MASQADVLAAVEAAGKVGAKAMLVELSKDGGAVSMEVDLLAAQAGAFGPEIAALVKPFISKVLDSVAAKLA